MADEKNLFRLFYLINSIAILKKKIRESRLLQFFLLLFCSRFNFHPCLPVFFQYVLVSLLFSLSCPLSLFAPFPFSTLFSFSIQSISLYSELFLYSRNFLIPLYTIQNGNTHRMANLLRKRRESRKRCFGYQIKIAREGERQIDRERKERKGKWQRKE